MKLSIILSLFNLIIIFIISFILIVGLFSCTSLPNTEILPIQSETVPNEPNLVYPNIVDKHTMILPNGQPRKI